MEERFLVSKDIAIELIIEGKYSVFHKVTKKTYALGEMECKLLKNLDGLKNLNNLSSESGFSTEQIKKLLEIYDKLGFLNTSDVKKEFHITRINIGVFNPNKILKTDGLFVKIMARILLYSFIPLMILGILLNSRKINLLSDLMQFTRIPLGLLIIPMALLVTFLHELGHVIIAKYYGANVPEMGVVFYWFMPAAYINLSCVTFIKEKNHRILVYLGGILMNLFLIALAFVIRGLVITEHSYILTWFIADSLVGLIFNLFIFLKYDGYLVLRELVGDNYLRENSIAFIKNKIASLRVKKNTSLIIQLGVQSGNLSKNTESLYTIYGILAVSYLPVLLISIAIGLLSVILR